MKFSVLSLFALAAISFSACTEKNSGHTPLPAKTAPIQVLPTDLAGYHKADFAGGCFWCQEAVFQSIKGVVEVVSGYSGGAETDPTYDAVGTGRTGHAEAVEVYYDSTMVDFSTLVRVYLASIDPTQVDGQGPDQGTQYRSIIFYRTPAEKQVAESALTALRESNRFSRPIAVQTMPFEKFWPAEEYHQNYVDRNPKNPYVQHESMRRLQRTQQQLPELVKPERSILAQ